MSERPVVSFHSKNLEYRLNQCEVVAKAHGWSTGWILDFKSRVRDAFTFEEAMEIIYENFETIEV